MKILVFGSLNIDRTYRTEAIVRPGQTLSASGLEEFCGGKGFNQAVALRRAGSEVFFAGAVGQDGQMLLDALDRSGVDRRFVRMTGGATGHAVIQVDPHGQNAIFILAGANGEITPEDVERTLAGFGEGDLIVLQNEIACMPLILRRAREKGMIVACNPSPFDSRSAAFDLRCIDYLLVNETEGAAMAGVSDPQNILDALGREHPHLNVALTLGSEGALFRDRSGRRFACPAFPVQAVDTTAAGDTFTGYFLSGMLRHGDAALALRTACAAAGIAVSRPGAEPSIPLMSEVLPLL